MISESSLIILLAGSDRTWHALKVSKVPVIHFERIYHFNEHLYCVEKDSEFDLVGWPTTKL